MKRTLFSIILIFSVTFLNSQVIDNQLLNDLKARSIGPGGMSGRVTAIAVEPGNDAVFYVGTASGGIWKTTNGGINFSPVFDNEAVSGIGALAVDPGNPDIVWAGTGEGNPRNSITGGYGIYRSPDAGRTWQLMGLEATRHIHRIIVHPGNSNILYIGAIGSPWGAHEERGVFKTTDGGQTWKKILYVNDITGVADMVIDKRNPEKLYVAMWEHLRHPWFFQSGGEGSGLYITVDGGENWKEITEKDGLPSGELGRIGLAASASNPNYVYALIESKKNAIYRSVDGGYSWEKRGDKNIGDRPFYYAELYVDPLNENRIYSLYSRVNISEDGGMTFSTLVGNNIHLDHHAWWIHPENPSFMIDGNDGGLAISYDMGKNWRHVTNLPVSQFYHIAVDNELPYNVYGGMQDNGSWKGPGYLWSSDGIINEYWDFLLGGDGFDVQPVRGDSKFCYAMSQGGNLQRINTQTGEGMNIMPAETDTKLRFHWNAALALDPYEENTLYYGSQFLHKSSDRGDSWEIISPDLTTNDTTRHLFHKSGGLTYDVTGAETYTCILTIAPSPVKKGVIWVGTDDGNIQLTRDGGESWVNTINKIKEFPDRPWVPQIVPSSYNEAEAFAVVNDYRQNNYAPYLYHTTDYGKSWTRLVDESDVEGYVLSFVQDPEVQELMFLGTEYGLYVSINSGRDWVKWKNGYPTVSTMDMAIQVREADLVIGTFGRSAYVIDDIRPLRRWAVQGDKFKAETIQLFDAPEAYMAGMKNAPGYYFHGDAYFKGENRKAGAMITYFAKKEAVEEGGKDKEEKEKKDTVLIRIMDETGDIVRTLEDVPDEGINRIYWNFDRDGIKLDFGRGRGRENKYPGGGGFAFTGDYTVRAVYKGDSSQTTLTVKPDPRVNYDLAGQRARQEYVNRVQSDLAKFNVKVKELNKCRKTLATIKELAADNPSEELKKGIGEMTKKFEMFDKELNGESDVQGIYRDETLFTYNVSPLIYLSYIDTPLTPNHITSMKVAARSLAVMETKIEQFLNEDWKEFRELVGKSNLSIF